MSNTAYPTKSSVLHRAQELVDAHITFGELDVSGRMNKRNKGDIGQIIEDNWFGYKPNSDSEPDFLEAGVELKVSPYKITSNGVSAKERLVCNIINYVDEAEKTFETSAFWNKCKCICLLFYKWSNNVQKQDMFIDSAILIDSYPVEDLLIIRQDWEKIIRKVKNGEAHLLTEGDTNYLAACTKGANSNTLRSQPYSEILAKQRAYSLKAGYVTQILRRFVFGESRDEHIIKDWKLLANQSFEGIILDMFNPYINKSVLDIGKMVGIKKENLKIKGINAIIIKKILGIHGNPDSTAEFKSANILVKTIVVQPSVMPEENMSFPPFKFLDILNQEWEESDVYEQMVSSRFLFVVFERSDRKNYAVLKGAFFWNMPAKDVDELEHVWNRAKASIKNGAGLFFDGKVVRNSLPKSSESIVAHVRPHAAKSAYILADGTVIGNPYKDANPLPDGQWMTTQSFWFSKKYIRDIILQSGLFVAEQYGDN